MLIKINRENNMEKKMILIASRHENKMNIICYIFAMDLEPIMMRRCRHIFLLFSFCSKTQNLEKKCLVACERYSSDDAFRSLLKILMMDTSHLW